MVAGADPVVACTTMISGADPSPKALDAVMTTLGVPTLESVPEMTPVAVSRLSPVGRPVAPKLVGTPEAAIL